MRIGLVSDTHGLLRPEALAWLRGSDRIVHAGDIGGPAILDTLAAIAPLTVVRGNNDRADWAAAIPEHAELVVDGVRIHVVHDLADFVHDAGAPPRVVVAGHSHRAAVRERDGVLHVNPGSAGPRRFKLPVSAGELVIEGGAVSARTVDLLA
ncbi:metallophosphoesterase family protein [Piscinibacter koreensis]|uniref:Phosphoesterase n=1 Tax=Piscinibacter koreensis TaxID=2742824 RepID=A0A7Y6TVW5_9BURK|nr:metallophosphoesterase family protein [Schlegelella koreensis]NUZ05387.1 metallophosphoesterase family protein [Schlegelella koreensis]